MEQRVAQFRGSNNRWKRRALLLTIPVALFFLIIGVRKVQEIRAPIEVALKPGDTLPTQELFDRLWVESQKYPYSTDISVGRSTPFPKESGLNLYNSENLEYSRSKGTLQYLTSAGIQGYGWTYGNVKEADIGFFRSLYLPNEPHSLLPTVASCLTKRGCTLQEQYSP